MLSVSFVGNPSLIWCDPVNILQGYAPTTCVDDIMAEVDLWSGICRASRAQATS